MKHIEVIFKEVDLESRSFSEQKVETLTLEEWEVIEKEIYKIRCKNNDLETLDSLMTSNINLFYKHINGIERAADELYFIIEEFEETPNKMGAHKWEEVKNLISNIQAGLSSLASEFGIHLEKASWLVSKRVERFPKNHEKATKIDNFKKLAMSVQAINRSIDDIRDGLYDFCVLGWSENIDSESMLISMGEIQYELNFLLKYVL